MGEIMKNKMFDESTIVNGDESIRVAKAHVTREGVLMFNTNAIRLTRMKEGDPLLLSAGRGVGLCKLTFVLGRAHDCAFIIKKGVGCHRGCLGISFSKFLLQNGIQYKDSRIVFNVVAIGEKDGEGNPVYWLQKKLIAERKGRPCRKKRTGM